MGSLNYVFLLVSFVVGISFRVVSVKIERLTETDRGKHDRTISYKELLDDRLTVIFEDIELQAFSHFVLDSKRKQIIVGARDHLLRLSLDNLTLMEKVKWIPDRINITTCLAKGQTEEDCHNYVRVLILHQDDGLLVCGTNAFSPLCTWRRPDKIAIVESQMPGIAKCPFSPHQNNTFLMTSDRNYYSATVTDFTARDAALYRTLGPSKHLRTVRFNSHWLNEPDFVSSYEIGEYIYFFFREAAIEYINCGKAVYSRVARICKSDAGGKILLEDNWTTFLKARLNCSLPGTYPFYFNELQDTFYDEEQQRIYAVFTTSPTSIYASAVCVYNISTIDQVFSGPYKHQSDAQMAWTRVPNSLPDLQCPNSQATSRRDNGIQSPPAQQRPLPDIQQYQMMDSSVQPIGLNPLVVVENERFMHIILDHVDSIVRSVNREIAVLFLSTLEGVVHKMAVLPGNPVDPGICLIEKIHLSDSGVPGFIHSMTLHKEQMMLYVATKQSFLRLSVQRCDRFTSKLRCLAAQDPYCGWNDHLERCIASGHPNLSSCPILNYPVDGSWSHWSPWLLCSHTGLVRDDDQCLCRVRSCDSPKPAFEGRDCTGRSVEVTNCTVDGGWTQWSLWSGCSQTCGSSLKTRTRSCTNPSPQYGGHLCFDEDVQTTECKLPPCPTAPPHLPVHGGWSSWMEWTSCSAACGVGFHSRNRVCNKPSPKHGGNGCLGNLQEWKICNMGDCEEVRRISEWSPWLRVNTTKDGGYNEERYRCVCKGIVLDPSYLKMPLLKTSMRHCSAGAEDCDAGTVGFPDVDGSWSSWSPWSACSALCGSGSQHRERLCNNPSPSGSGRECHGPARELTSCNTHLCTAQWTCWSDFTSCSASCGVGGVRQRVRRCESELSEKQFVFPCEGDDAELVPCDRPSCQGLTSWSPWSPWSRCNYDNVQERRRRCLVDESSCPEATLETRLCTDAEPAFYEVLDMDHPRHPVPVSHRKEFYSYHLVTTALVSFFVGAIGGGFIFYFVLRHCCMPNFLGIGKTTHVEAKPNAYMCHEEMIPPPPNLSDDSHTYSTLTFDSKLTVKDATLRRNLLLRSDSFMRTKLDQPDGF